MAPEVTLPHNGKQRAQSSGHLEFIGLNGIVSSNKCQNRILHARFILENVFVYNSMYLGSKVLFLGFALAAILVFGL